MPLDVIMPALGMAQDTGLIIAWLKQPGDAVSSGDVLFEVETDKATMEVEAAGDGYLTHVSAAAGEAVPVGQVIAKISDSPDVGANATQAPDTAASIEDALPAGQTVIMPTLGMAQDTGLLIAWLKEPGAAVAQDDILFEVETDKSTVEVPAGFDGYLAAVLAEAGEDVPVGQTIAIIAETAPQAPVVRSAKASAAVPTASTVNPAEGNPAEAKLAEANAQATSSKPQATLQGGTAAGKKANVRADGRILASPKARRLAQEQGLDLARLADAGHPQPYHVTDLDVLRSLPVPGTTAPAAAAQASLRLTALVEAPGLDAFATWASEQGQSDAAALLAGFAAASLGQPACVTVETLGQSQSYDVPLGAGLSAVAPCSDPDCTPALILRDLRWSRVTSLSLGSEDSPTLSITQGGAGLELTLEAAPSQLSGPQAIALISNFADRLAQPLRHLL